MERFSVQERRKISFESLQCFPTDARFWRDFSKRNTHLRRGKNELIFESIDIYIPFAQDDISKPRPEVSCREANIKHGTTLMPCKFRDILAIRAIIDADQRYGLNKRTRDPPFPQGIDNSRLFISFCPESAAFVLCDRTSDRSPYRARYHFTHARMLGAVINSGPKIEIRAIINAGNLQGQGMCSPSVYETEHPPLLIAPI